MWLVYRSFHLLWFGLGVISGLWDFLFASWILFHVWQVFLNTVCEKQFWIPTGRFDFREYLKTCKLAFYALYGFTWISIWSFSNSMKMINWEWLKKSKWKGTHVSEGTKSYMCPIDHFDKVCRFLDVNWCHSLNHALIEFFLLIEFSIQKTLFLDIWVFCVSFTICWVIYWCKWYPVFITVKKKGWDLRWIPENLVGRCLRSRKVNDWGIQSCGSS